MAWDQLVEEVAFSFEHWYQVRIFGNRVAVMPENSSKPGDQAMNLPPRDAHVQIDAYSSSLVKDIIFGGKGDALPMSAAAAAASNDPLVESTRH